MVKVDFSYFCAITAPYASPEELRTMCDWGNWVFPYDDQFDNGILKNDRAQARATMQQLLEPMVDPSWNEKTYNSSNALVAMHTDVWARIRKRSSKGACRRFVEAMTDYCKGTLDQVDNVVLGVVPDANSFLATRRKSAGVTPLFALVEYAYALDIPDHIMNHEAIHTIQRLGAEFVLLQNDMLSYHKEQREGVSHNLVALYRSAGFSAEASFKILDKLLHERYHEWYATLAQMPSWGGNIDFQVQRYIQGVQNVVLANLNWSFRSSRYFGANKDIVRTTGFIDVLPVEPLIHMEPRSFFSDMSVGKLRNLVSLCISFVSGISQQSCPAIAENLHKPLVSTPEKKRQSAIVALQQQRETVSDDKSDEVFLPATPGGKLLLLLAVSITATVALAFTLGNPRGLESQSFSDAQIKVSRNDDGVMGNVSVV
ncbi:MAG: hypothetical protein M1831_005375 [Alyxoria varia]|nr:MAG: hypothetical protein M1831_005375 [Alyxoria varia]